jgi:hypothetical protein
VADHWKGMVWRSSFDDPKGSSGDSRPQPLIGYSHLRSDLWTVMTDPEPRVWSAFASRHKFGTPPALG